MGELYFDLKKKINAIDALHDVTWKRHYSLEKLIQNYCLKFGNIKLIFASKIKMVSRMIQKSEKYSNKNNMKR